MNKSRTNVPPEVAARTLFLHDRTCCICRRSGKPVQIHHIDDNPKNHEERNLAILCFDCHRETQIRGGFDRKLDAEQVILYRDDWVRIVARNRAQDEARREKTESPSNEQLELVTSLAEIYRENEQHELLAIHYNRIGNRELRDKYIEISLAESTSDQKICFLRGLQGRPDLIPKDVIDRELLRHDASKDWSQKGRFLQVLGLHRDAAISYVHSILESLEEGRIFSAAYYLKELAEDELTPRLFELAFREAKDRDDLWWQVRALQELGWRDELKQLLHQNRQRIEQSEDLLLLIELANADGNTQRFMDLKKEIAQGTRIIENKGVVGGKRVSEFRPVSSTEGSIRKKRKIKKPKSDA